MIPNHRKARSEPEARRKVRCAVYTRKSTEEGLEQEFNSLDAQRESGEAYVRSQASEGWVLLPKRYDDGGFSGGTLERPALAALVEDIKAGKVDCVVVYKVDRLSRSLTESGCSLRLRPKRTGQGIHIAPDHRDDARPLDGEVAVDEAVAEPDDGAKVRDAILAEARASDLFPDRDDLIRRGERVKHVDADITRLHRTAPGRGGTPRAVSGS